MALLYGRAGRLTAKNGGFRPGRAVALPFAFAQCGWAAGVATLVLTVAQGVYCMQVSAATCPAGNRLAPYPHHVARHPSHDGSHESPMVKQASDEARVQGLNDRRRPQVLAECELAVWHERRKAATAGAGPANSGAPGGAPGPLLAWPGDSAGVLPAHH
jgi:hypothetical protein